MAYTSAGEYQFCRGEAPGDGTCLFWSGLAVFKLPSTKLCNKALRILTANYIRRHPDLHVWVLNSGTTCKTVEEYCSSLEQGRLLAGEIELKVLSKLFNTVICVIFITKQGKEKKVWSSYYGSDNPLATKCVYIHCEELFRKKKEGHYEPMYLMDMQNSNEKETIFDPDDDTVNQLLRKFIKEVLEYDGFVQLGINNHASVNEVPRPDDDSIETEMVSTLVFENSATKRKASEIDDIVSPPNDDKKQRITTSDRYCDPNKRTKFHNAASDTNSKLYNNKTDSMAIEELIQTDRFDDTSISVPMIMDPPVSEQSIADQTTGSSDQHKKNDVNEQESVKESVDDLQNNN